MIHCNIVTFSIVIPFQINCKTHCNSFSCDDVLLKYHYYYYYYNNNESGGYDGPKTQSNAMHDI